MIYAVVETYNDRNSRLWFVDMDKFDDSNECEAILKTAILAGVNDHYTPEAFTDRLVGQMGSDFLFRTTVHTFPVKVDEQSHIWQK
jgi:hypothetical protein